MANNYETRDMTGSLFKNERKTQPNQPDFQGKIKVENVEWWVSAWVKTAATSGKQYLSLAISEPMDTRASPPGAADSFLDGASPAQPSWKNNPPQGDLDDDIPF